MSVPAQTLKGAPIPAPIDARRLVAIDQPASAAAEQYRLLFQRLERLGQARPLRVVAVTSSTRVEGRTTTAVNLALTAAQEGRKVILVECDLRRPTLAQLLDLAPRAGLCDVVDGTSELSQAVCRTNGISVLCAGEPKDPAAVLRSERLRPLLDGMRAAFDWVILDAPPALAFADAERLAAAADGALLVVRAQRTPRAVVRLALQTLGDRTVGIVLNDVGTSGNLHGRYLYGDPEAA